MDPITLLLLIGTAFGIFSGVADWQNSKEEETLEAESTILSLEGEKTTSEGLIRQYESNAQKYVIDDVADTAIEKNIQDLWTGFEDTKGQIQEQRDYIISQQKVGLAAGGISGKSGSALLIEEDSRRKAQEDIYAAKKNTKGQVDIITTTATDDYNYWMGLAGDEEEKITGEGGYDEQIAWWEETYLSEEGGNSSSGGKTSTGEHVGAR